MIGAFKFFFAGCLLLSAGLLAAAEAPSSRPLIPIFDALDPQGQVIGTLDASWTVRETRRNAVLPRPAANISDSRLRYVRDAFFVTGPAGQHGWVIDGVFLTPSAGGGWRKEIAFQGDSALWPWTLVLAGATALWCAVFGRRARRRGGFTAYLLSGEGTAAALSSLALFRILGVMATLYRSGRFLIFTYDEEGYFNTGQALLGRHDPLGAIFTIGNGMAHAIAAAVTGAGSAFETIPALSWFNALAAGSVAIVLVFLFAELVGFDRKAALTAAALFALYPFFIQVDQPVYRYAVDFPGFPEAREYSGRLFYWSALVGFDALSDFPNMVYLLALFVFAARVHRGGTAAPPLWVDCVIGAFFGLSGTLRVADIFMAPALLYLVVGAALARKDYAAVAKRLIVFGAGAVAGFSPQLVMNALASGSIFALPYASEYHRQASRGFLWAKTATGLPFLLNGASFLIAAALCGLWVSSRRIRIFAAFYLLPLFGFYCGFGCVSQHAVRWVLPLYPLLFALAAAALLATPSALFSAVFVAGAIRCLLLPDAPWPIAVSVALALSCGISGVLWRCYRRRHAVSPLFAVFLIVAGTIWGGYLPWRWAALCLATSLVAIGALVRMSREEVT